MKAKAEGWIPTQPAAIASVADCDREVAELWRALLLVSKGSKASVMTMIDAMLDRRNELSGQTGV